VTVKRGAADHEEHHPADSESDQGPPAEN
jgi:hypothetical protein